MGRNSQQRRAKKLRQSQQRLRRDLAGGRGSAGTIRSIPELVQLACAAAVGPMASRPGFQHIVGVLQRAEETEADPLDRPSAEVLRQLRLGVDAAQEAGLQPADVVHLARREFT
ncbi:MAG TPA: hypothetical protein DCR14_10635, partial [Acidimicrobiaceae bacterium]|nr:hypothetical protein [Acidimicrobiaceae bacterium]